VIIASYSIRRVVNGQQVLRGKARTPRRPQDLLHPTVAAYSCGLWRRPIDVHPIKFSARREPPKRWRVVGGRRCVDTTPWQSGGFLW